MKQRETIIAIPSPKVSLGHCIVMIDEQVVYMGRISGAVPYLADGVKFFLNPYDFNDGSAYMKRHGV